MFGSQSSASRDPLAGMLIWLAAALGASWLLGDWIVGGSGSELAFISLALVVAVIGLATLHHWPTGLYLFLVWLTFEDLARKFLGNNMTVYFAKDVLVGICYFSFALSLKRGTSKSFRPPILLAFGLFFFLGLAQAFNPNSPSVLYGLLGLKLYFYYAPLLFLGYALCGSEKDLVRFLVVNVCLAGFVALLGIIQAIVGLDFLNPPVLAPELRPLGQLVRFSPISHLAVPRPTSVFVSDGRFALYVVMMWILAIGAVGYLFIRGHRARYLGLLCAALVFIASILSGARGAFLYTLASCITLAVGFFWGSPMHWSGSRRLARVVRKAFAFVSLAFVISLLIFPAAMTARWAFYYETLAPDSPASEFGTRAWDYPIQNTLDALAFPNWPMGYGIGTNSLGVYYVKALLGQPDPGVGVEGGYGTLLLELGILGPVLWLFWTTSLVRSGWRAVRKLRGSALFPIGFSILWFVFLVLFPFTFGAINAYQNFSTNAYLWLTVGILLRLPALQEQEQSKPRGAFGT